MGLFGSLGGLFGGGSNSGSGFYQGEGSNSGIGSSNSKNTTENKTNSKPITLQDAAGAVVSSTDISTSGAVNITDGGAIKAMLDATAQFLSEQNKASGQFLTFAENASKEAMNVALTSSNPDQATTKWVLLAVVGIAAVLAFSKGK